MYEVTTPNKSIHMITEEQLPYFLLDMYFNNAIKAMVATAELARGKTVKFKKFSITPVKEAINVSR